MVKNAELYEYKGHKYLTLDAENAKMKDPKTGLWVDAVIYVKDPAGRKLDKEYTSYIRMKSEFEHNFVAVR